MVQCVHCGAELPQEAKFCGKCGGQQPAAEATVTSPVAGPPPAAPVPPVPVSAPPRRRATVWMAATAVVVVGVLVAAYIVLFSRTPRQLLAEANIKYWNSTASDLGKGAASLWTAQSRMTKEPSTSKATLSGSLKTAGRVREIEQIQRLLDKSSIVVVSKNDPKADTQSVDLKLNLRGSELISGEFFRSPNQLGLRVPVLHDKYVVAENRDLKNTLKKVGIPWNGPDSLVSNTNLEKTLKTEELLPVLLEYGKFLNQSVRDEEITLAKVPYESPDGTVTLRQVTLHLTEARLKEILKGLSQKLRDDEKSLDLLSQTFADLMKQAASGVAASDPTIKQLQDKNYVKQQLRDGSREFGTALDDLVFPDGLKVTLLVDRSNNLVHERILFSVAPRNSQQDVVTMEATLSNWKGKNGTDRGVVLSMREGTGKSSFEGTFALKSRQHPASGNEERSTTTVDVDIVDFGSKENMHADVLTTVTRGAEKGKDRYVYDATINIGDKKTGGTIKATLTSLRSDSAKGNHYEDTSDLTMNITGAGVPGVDVQLKLETAVDFGQPPQFPTFSGTNSVNLTTASSREVDTVRIEIQRGMERFVQRNMSLLGDLFR